MSDVPQTGQVAQPAASVYAGPSLETIRSILDARFLVKDAFLDPYGVPTIQIAAEPVKKKFKELLKDLSNKHLVAVVRGSGSTLTIRVFQKPERRPPRRMINLALFLATLATVFGAGLFLWSPIASIIDPSANSYAKAGEFAAGLMAIVGLHEFGHKAATRYHGLDASLPYFIPGPPPFIPIGTFGAVISLREPPANRDQLFDLGLSGPMVGFIVTIIVSIFAIVFGTPLNDNQVGQLVNQGFTYSTWPNTSLIIIIVSSLHDILRPGLANIALYSQLDFAAQIGALLTFLNLIPAWQLDGGHISRATFGVEGHRIATVLGVIVVFLTGFVSFAILLLVFMTLSRRGLSGVEPLDDVSPISNSRKLVYLLALVTLLLTFSYIPLL